MIYTSSYKSIKSEEYDTISMSRDKGKDAGYVGTLISD